MQTKLAILIPLIMYCTFSFASTNVPINDTIRLDINQVEGRWIETNDKTGRADIYIFRDDYTFHKANDSGELLFFNIAGKYTLSNDSVKVLYQDFSRRTTEKVKVRTMYLQVISLSDNELNINKTENNRTEFIRLRRQNAQ